MPKLKALFIHAHFDDYEFTGAGLFELWKQQLGEDFEARVIVCTDGKAGHQFRTREETGKMRMAEMEASAQIGGFDFRPLRYRNGEIPREACLQVDIELLAALWKEIRDFEPDYLFCPPVINDPFAGIHIDHVAVAEAVRKVAYMINVPHAFTPEYPADETVSALCKVPVILNCRDAYMKTDNELDFYVNIDDAFDQVCRMSYCHQSQIVEWLPWVSSPSPMQAPENLDAWRKTLRLRYRARSERNGLDAEAPYEAFTVTAWGSVPNLEDLRRDFPNFIMNEAGMAAQLRRWSGK